jgi:GNAT superfamily N-acetyltransferase
VTGRTIKIRAASLDDAAEIARLSGELGYPADTHAIRARLAGLLSGERHYVAVADAADGRLLGWTHVEQRRHLVDEETAEIMGLVVDSHGRRGGVGRSLVAAIEQWAAARGLGRIVVRSNVMRAESHPFYEALGYARKKTQHTYKKALGRR